MTQPTTQKAPTWRTFERGNDDVKGTDDMLKVPLSRIRIKPGFNPRDINKPATQAKIERIKLAYKNGEYVQPMDVCLASADFLEVVEGHCRFEAATRAHAEMIAEGGVGIVALNVIAFKGNDAARVVHTVMSQENEKLLPVEIANSVLSLTNMGWPAAKIADTFGYSVGWVNKLLFMAGMPEAVKNMIKADVISTDVAVAAVKEHGDGAAPVLEELVKTKTQEVAAKEEAAAKPKAQPPHKPESMVEAKTTTATKPEKADTAPSAPKVKVTSKDVAAKKAPAKKTLDVEVFLSVREMALGLPELPFEDAVFNPTQQYNLCLDGKAIRLLQDLKNLFQGEAQ